MLGSVAGWLASHRLVGVAAVAGFSALAGVTAWAATPIPAAGLLVDAAGRPVAGAVVSAATTLVSPSAQARSDGQGRYRLGAVRWPYGEPSLSVRAAGFLPAQTPGGRLVLHRWPHLTGQAVDESGTPVPGAVVTVGRLTAVMADMDGRFDLLLPARAGTFAVTAFSDQHDSGTGQVSLAIDGSAQVRLVLPRQFSAIHVVSDPAGQVPSVDGTPASDCPGTPCDVRVLAGSHRVELGGDLFLPWSADVTAARDATATVTATLERKTGTLSVTAPAGGELSVDGKPVPGAAWSGTVPTGSHVAGFRSASTWPALQRVDVAWNQTAQAALAPSGVAADAAGFTAGLQAYLNAQGGGSYGVYLEDLGTGAAIGVGETSRLEAASVIKVPEAIYLLRQADAGAVNLDDSIDLKAGDFMGGTGTLFGRAHAGDKYTYRQLVTLLIQQSDNTAWMALRRVLGDAAINAYSASVGAGDCSQVTDWCSARSAGHMMAELARGRLVSAASTRLLLGLLETTVFNDRINYYLPGTTIAHKVGMDGAVRNDCGVVLSAHPFAICVFTTVNDIDQGVQVIRDIARAAAWRWGH